MSDWIILHRVARGRTLALAETLAEAGFEVWTPVEERERLAGPKRELVEQKLPVMPGYLFAHGRHISELLGLSRSPTLNFQVWDHEQRCMVTRGHPTFRVMYVNGLHARASDNSLRPLRALEARLAEVAQQRRERALVKGPIPQFEAGQAVVVDGGGFEGLTLTVAEANKGKLVRLVHPAWMWAVEISAWKLQAIQIMSGSPEQGAAVAA